MNSERKNCNELLNLICIMEKGLMASLENITSDVLNFSPSENKMSIGQLAVHCMAWAEYFMADNNNKPWEPVKWTCKPVTYPLKFENVKLIIDNGLKALRLKLNSINDLILENIRGEKGPGYIIYRLLIHMMVHSNQMAYIRQIKDKDWQYGSNFGDMATAIINMNYRTERDISVGGF